MKRQQSGFTLIELVMVIVILGLLAVTAIPTFVDLSGDAQQAATDGVAGALGSASVINYGSRSANAANGIAVDDCADLAGALTGGMPAGWAAPTGGAIADNGTTT